MWVVYRHHEISLQEKRWAMPCTCPSIFLLRNFKKGLFIDVLVQWIGDIVFLFWAQILPWRMVVTTGHWFVKESHKQRIFTLFLHTFWSVVFLFCDLSIESGYLCSLLFESRIVCNKSRITLIFFDYPNFLGCILNPAFIKNILTTLYILLRLIQIILLLEWLKFLIASTFVGLPTSMAIF